MKKLTTKISRIFKESVWLLVVVVIILLVIAGMIFQPDSRAEEKVL